MEEAITTKFCNLCGIPRVTGPAVAIALELSSTKVTACISSDQKLETIKVDDPAMPTVCNS